MIRKAGRVCLVPDGMNKNTSIPAKCGRGPGRAWRTWLNYDVGPPEIATCIARWLNLGRDVDGHVLYITYGDARNQHARQSTRY